MISNANLSAKATKQQFTCLHIVNYVTTLGKSSGYPTPRTKHIELWLMVVKYD